MVWALSMEAEIRTGVGHLERFNTVNRVSELSGLVPTLSFDVDEVLSVDLLL